MTHDHRKQGPSGSPTYQSWRKMKSRCNDPNDKRYHRYGMRGIRVCVRWAKFENFLKDMGERPEGMTLDRINVNRGYNKKNCRWATRLEQAKDCSTFVFFEGISLSIRGWAARLHMPPSTLFRRLKAGWSIEKALTPPLQGGKDANQVREEEDDYARRGRLGDQAGQEQGRHPD